MNSEKAGADDLLKSLVDCLINDAIRKLVTKYKRFIDQIDSFVNLIFGLELKIANIQNSGKSTVDADLWKNRLEEAISIKVMHDETLNVKVNHLDASNQLLFRDKIKSKQKLICELRLVNQELHYLEIHYN